MKKKINDLIQEWKIEATQLLYKQNLCLDQYEWAKLEAAKKQLSKCCNELYEIIKK